MNNYTTKRLSLLLVAFLISVVFYRCSAPLNETDFEKFLDEFNAEYIDLNNAVQLAEFNAAVSGNDEDYQKSTDLNIQVTKLFSSKSKFKKLKKFKEQNIVEDALLLKQLNFLYNQYLFHQIDQNKMVEMVTAAKKLTRKFSVYRTIIDNVSYSDSEVENMLKNTLSSDKLEMVWKASKEVGSTVADDIIKLVKMRNEAAQSLGFENYFIMSLEMSGQDIDKLENIYSEFDLLSEGIYDDLKIIMDERLSTIYSVPQELLMPWHYQNRFFQKAPNIYDVNLDVLYKGKNIVELANKYFSGIGLDISGILKKSDLHEKSGKAQTGFCTDIDRNGDVRILANIEDDEYSMNTLLYESGFALYLKSINNDLPYLLRSPSHFFTVDAVATLFSQFSTNSDWLNEIAGISVEEKARIEEDSKKYLLLSKVVFSRWAQVMYHFEKSMYENPEQDLNKLWWVLVEKYQKLNKPANWDNPDWASKNHLITKPCTYHNYILGELFAAQLHHYIKNNIANHGNGAIKCINNPEIGKYLIEKVFKPGKSMNWEELILNATGEDLNPDYFKTTCLDL